MQTTFSLRKEDHARLQCAVSARLERIHGRLHLPFFMQTIAWMFVAMGMMTFYSQWQREPIEATKYGVIVAFAVLGFLLSNFRPLTVHRLYQKYFFDSSPSFTMEQSVEFRGSMLVLESAAFRSEVLRAAVMDHTEDAHNHYLFISGVQAIILPKHVVVRLGNDLNDFLALPSTPRS
jgi:hypothetical protein